MSHTIIVSNTKPLRYKYNNSVYNIFALGNHIPNPIPRPEGGIKIHASRQRSMKPGHTPQEPTCSIHEYHMFRPSLLRHYMLMITPLHTPRLFSPQSSTVEPRYEEVTEWLILFCSCCLALPLSIRYLACGELFGKHPQQFYYPIPSTLKGPGGCSPYPPPPPRPPTMRWGQMTQLF